MDGGARSFAVLSASLKPAVAPATIKTGTMTEKRGRIKYKTIPSDYHLSIERKCHQFKQTYALRSECERYNSRFKASGQERLWIRNGTSATNLNTLSYIAALAVACAAVQYSPRHSFQSAKLLRRTA